MIQPIIVSIGVGVFLSIGLNISFKLIWNKKNNDLPKRDSYLISYRKGGTIVPLILISLGSYASYTMFSNMILKENETLDILLYGIILFIIVVVCFVIPLSGLYQMYFKAIKVEEDKVYIIGLFKTKEFKRSEITKIEKKYRYQSYKDLKGTASKALFENNYKYVFYNNMTKLFVAERSMVHIDFFVEDLKDNGAKII